MHSLRDLFDAIRYVVKTGCQWRFLANELSPGPRSINRDAVGCTRVFSSTSRTTFARLFDFSATEPSKRRQQFLMDVHFNRRPKVESVPDMTGPRKCITGSSLTLLLKTGGIPDLALRRDLGQSKASQVPMTSGECRDCADTVSQRIDPCGTEPANEGKRPLNATKPASEKTHAVGAFDPRANY